MHRVLFSGWHFATLVASSFAASRRLTPWSSTSNALATNSSSSIDKNAPIFSMATFLLRITASTTFRPFFVRLARATLLSLGSETRSTNPFLTKRSTMLEALGRAMPWTRAMSEILIRARSQHMQNQDLRESQVCLHDKVLGGQFTNGCYRTFDNSAILATSSSLAVMGFPRDGSYDSITIMLIILSVVKVIGMIIKYIPSLSIIKIRFSRQCSWS